MHRFYPTMPAAYDRSPIFEWAMASIALIEWGFIIHYL